jgi:hypothetical protein
MGAGEHVGGVAGEHVQANEVELSADGSWMD